MIKILDIQPAIHISTFKFKKDKQILLPPNEEFKLNIIYPLTNKFQKSIKTGRKGLTKNQLIHIIYKSYKQIYREEDGGIKEVARANGMYNRITTAGKYGIYGHDIGDLVLESISIKENIIDLFVGS